MLVVVLNVLWGSIGFLSRDDDAIFLKHTSLFELVNLNALQSFLSLRRKSVGPQHRFFL